MAEDVWDDTGISTSVFGYGETVDTSGPLIMVTVQDAERGETAQLVGQVFSTGVEGEMGMPPADHERIVPLDLEASARQGAAMFHWALELLRPAR